MGKCIPVSAMHLLYLIAALLARLCPSTALLLQPTGFKEALAPQHQLRPRACSGGVVMIDPAPLAEQLPTMLVVDGNPMFSEIFLAGMSIAVASVVATVFVGIIVRGNY